MAPPKLPPAQRTRNGCVSLLEAEWDGVDAVRRQRDHQLRALADPAQAPPRRVSRSSIVREAVREYLQRKFGLPEPVEAGAA
jgi:hypothetical protein